MTAARSTYKSKKGAALATVVMIMLVMMVLVIPVLASSLSNTKQTVKYENIAQAHYTARTGAEVLAASVIDDQSYENISTLIASTGISDTVNGNAFKATITALDASYDTLLVESTGTANDESETVLLTLSRAGGFFRYAIFGDELLGLGGSHNTTIIGGNVGTNADSHTGNVTFVPDSNSIQYSQEYELDPINTNFYISNNATFINNITGGQEINLNDYEPYDFNANNEPIVLLRVQEINLSGNDVLTITGPGELHLLVENDFRMGGNPEFLPNESTPNTKVYIDYNGTAEFNFNGHLQIDGYIYAPNATIRVNGGVGSIVGSLMAKSIDIRGGNFSITYTTDLSDESIATSYKYVGWDG